jgi:hypothetical protein
MALIMGAIFIKLGRAPAIRVIFMLRLLGMQNSFSLRQIKTYRDKEVINVAECSVSGRHPGEKGSRCPDPRRV